MCVSVGLAAKGEGVFVFFEVLVISGGLIYNRSWVSRFDVTHILHSLGVAYMVPNCEGLSPPG